MSAQPQGGEETVTEKKGISSKWLPFSFALESFSRCLPRRTHEQLTTFARMPKGMTTFVGERSQMMCTPLSFHSANPNKLVCKQR